MPIARFFPMSIIGSALGVMCIFLPACTFTSGGLNSTPVVRELTLWDVLTSDFLGDGFEEDDMWIVSVAAGALASFFVRLFGLLVLAGAVRLLDLLDFTTVDGPSCSPEYALYLLVISSFIIMVGPVSSMEISGRRFKVRIVRGLRAYLEGLSSAGFRGATPKVSTQHSS